MNSDGTILYFCSDRPGGYGGQDIYKCEKAENGEWGTSINLGKTINTTLDESAPCILSDDVTLYFSSQGNKSMGGFDVFISTLNEDGFWSLPENINVPINSGRNELFFSLSADESQIFITRY